MTMIWYQGPNNTALHMYEKVQCVGLDRSEQYIALSLRQYMTATE